MTITEFRTQFEQMETTDLEGCIAGMCKRYEIGAFMSCGFAAGEHEAETWAERITLAETVLSERMTAAQTLVNSVFGPKLKKRSANTTSANRHASKPTKRKSKRCWKATNIRICRKAMAAKNFK